MIQDFAELPAGSLFEADICVIGGGPAGITTVRALRGSGLRVLLLESGGREVEEVQQDLVRGTSSRPYEALNTNRLRRLGGTSGHWAGQSLPLDPLDFRERPWVPDSGWPIPYEEFRRWLPEAMELCGLGAEPFTYAAWSDAAGLPEQPPFSEKVQVVPFRFSSPPVDFGEAYQADLNRDPSIQVVLHATVKHLVPNEAGTRVEEALIQTPSGKVARARAGRFVLATGALENCRLLLLSQAATGKPFGNAHDLVGRYVMEHPKFDASHAVLEAGPALSLLRKHSRKVKVGGSTVRFHFRYTDAEQERLQILNHSLFFARRHPKTPQSEAMQVLLDHERGERARGNRSFKLRIRLEHAPYASSRVTLGPTEDALGNRRIHVDYRFGDLESRTMEALERAVALELGVSGLGRLRVEQRAPGAWEERVGWQDHHLGGTRMDPDPKRGVVDVDGKIHGMDNLYCAGSSVFPTGGHANPTLNLVAMALRLGNHLRERR